MNREILFRGKRVDNGKWAEGSYCPKRMGYYKGQKFVRDIQHMIIVDMNGGGYQYADVDPETVCQYTGLTDKNGRKIFEGDILNVIYSDPQGECHYAEDYVIDDLRNTSVIGWLDYANELEITGNIFGNPELLD